METFFVVKRDATIEIVRSYTKPKGYYVTKSEKDAKRKSREMLKDRQWA